MFRLQPNLDTRQKQIDAWMSLVLAYHRYHKKYTLDVTEIQSSPLFNNTSIDSIFCLLCSISNGCLYNVHDTFVLVVNT